MMAPERPHFLAQALAGKLERTAAAAAPPSPRSGMMVSRVQVNGFDPVVFGRCNRTPFRHDQQLLSTVFFMDEFEAVVVLSRALRAIAGVRRSASIARPPKF